LLVLAAGKKLYRSVNVDAYLRQASRADGFWVWFSEVLSSHPNLTKRVIALKQGAAQRTYDDLMTKQGIA
jgi:Zn-dependent protease with chaperone function